MTFIVDSEGIAEYFADPVTDDDILDVALASPDTFEVLYVRGNVWVRLRDVPDEPPFPA